MPRTSTPTLAPTLYAIWNLHECAWWRGTALPGDPITVWIGDAGKIESENYRLGFEELQREYRQMHPY